MVDSKGNIITTGNIGYPTYFSIPGLEVHHGRTLKDIKKDINKVVSEKAFDSMDEIHDKCFSYDA